MNTAQQVSRLKTLLARVQQRAKEPRVAAAASAAPAEVPVELAAALVIATPAAAPPPARAPAPVPSVEEVTEPRKPGLQAAAPAPKAPERAAQSDELADIEFDELGLPEKEAEKKGEEAALLGLDDLDMAPDSSKRPKQEPEREFAAPPQTPPPESGPQEAAASRGDELELDFEPARPAPLQPAAGEQLDKAVEAGKPTEQLLEIAPPAPAEDKPVKPATPVPPPAPREELVAVRLVTPVQKLTVEVHAELASSERGVTAATAAAFVGATRTFHPEAFAQLLDASLQLGKS